MAAKRFKKVLVANRGEIAVRVIQGLREMGIASVAVHSDVDRTALHVLMADEAVAIGPAPAGESYLVGERIVAAALDTGAEAIHPGYGFLSENADFADAVEQAGLVFIGPTARSMRLMGDKLSARRHMIAAGVPVVPGTEDAVTDPDEAVAVAGRIGYPVLLKASAGGGGKGMRVVRSAGEMAAALRQTRGEAGASFADDAVFVEKYIEDPKHIEVQVVGDGRGEVVHLFERECSVQRRHQKVIEESPSPSLTPDLRARICAAAVQTARAVDYRGAGTVEFILAPDGSFHFLEMNTRLQVEHPVTELVTGTDLVRAQVLVAQGDGLPWRQDELAQRGWAMEFRLYAEDPSRGFVPSIGRIESLTVPLGPGVRLDTGVYEGFDVPIHYDPLLAKLIVWAEDRDRCIARARRALGEFVLHGPVHNLPFHRWALDQPAFRDGSYTTHFVADSFDQHAWLPELDEDARTALIAAAALYEAGRRSGHESPPGSRGGGASNWRLSALRSMTGNG
ncbi:MAG: acetyl-CoA carboxylase biotin carboxylase subunit [Krumholzibacteria bacterium]|nr:acetyl-CoA carboxylase biotin carboxylase subunit [Candidatus Krumholzibacteria bacterium]